MADTGSGCWVPERAYRGKYHEIIVKPQMELRMASHLCPYPESRAGEREADGNGIESVQDRCPGLGEVACAVCHISCHHHRGRINWPCRLSILRVLWSSCPAQHIPEESDAESRHISSRKRVLAEIPVFGRTLARLDMM